MREIKTYPIHYFCRGAQDSDKDIILKLMRAIPSHLKHEVSETYEGIYKDGSGDCRRLANEYLHNIAKEYRDKPIEKTVENGNYGHLDHLVKPETKPEHTDSGVKKKDHKPGRKTIEGFVRGDY